MSSWTWALASARGTSHRSGNEPCQDAAFCCAAAGSPSTLLAVLSDGAGSASFGGAGAKLAVRSIISQMRDHCSNASSKIDDEVIRGWVDVGRDRISRVAEQRNLARRDFAATLIGILANPLETIVFHVGDGAVIAEEEPGGAWHTLSWPAHGEYASTTCFVTDDPEPNLRVTRIERRISALVACTDGLERLALDFAQQKPHDPFFASISAPVRASTVQGRDRGLSHALQGYLDGPQVNRRTDDDKTLLVAVMR